MMMWQVVTTSWCQWGSSSVIWPKQSGDTGATMGAYLYSNQTWNICVTASWESSWIFAVRFFKEEPEEGKVRSFESSFKEVPEGCKRQLFQVFHASNSQPEKAAVLPRNPGEFSCRIDLNPQVVSRAVVIPGCEAVPGVVLVYSPLVAAFL